MHKSFRPFGLIAVSLVGVSAVAPARADTALVSVHGKPQSTVRHYEIPAGPLAAALNRFADENDLALVYTAALTEGLRTKGISGEYTLASALDQLLSETGLVFRFTSVHAVVIERPPVKPPHPPKS